MDIPNPSTINDFDEPSFNIDLGLDELDKYLFNDKGEENVSDSILANVEMPSTMSKVFVNPVFNDCSFVVNIH